MPISDINHNNTHKYMQQKHKTVPPTKHAVHYQSTCSDKFIKGVTGRPPMKNILTATHISTPESKGLL